MKLAQWAGRGVRTETDRAVITVCDTRLTTMATARRSWPGCHRFQWYNRSNWLKLFERAWLTTYPFFMDVSFSDDEIINLKHYFARISFGLSFFCT